MTRNRVLLSVFVMAVIGTASYAYWLHGAVCDKGNGFSLTQTLGMCGPREFVAEVDYSKTLIEAVRDAGIRTYSSNKLEQDFPHDGVGKSVLRFRLVSLGDVSRQWFDVAAAAIELGGPRRPATAKELVAFVAKYPRVVRRAPLLAVGTIVRRDISRFSWASAAVSAQWSDIYNEAELDVSTRYNGSAIAPGFLFLVVEK